MRDIFKDRARDSGKPRVSKTVSSSNSDSATGIATVASNKNNSSATSDSPQQPAGSQPNNEEDAVLKKKPLGDTVGKLQAEFLDSQRRVSDVPQSSAIDSAVTQDIMRKNSLPSKTDNSLKKQAPAPPVRKVGFGSAQNIAAPSVPMSSSFDMMVLKQMVGSLGPYKPAASSTTDKKVGFGPEGSFEEKSVENDTEVISTVKKTGGSFEEVPSTKLPDKLSEDSTVTKEKEKTVGNKVGVQFNDVVATAATDSANYAVPTLFKVVSTTNNSGGAIPAITEKSDNSQPATEKSVPPKDPKAELLQQLQRKLDIETKVCILFE